MASFESTERHLTAAGWVTGTEIWDGGRREVSLPSGRVLTVLWYESGSGFSIPIGSQKELWRCRDDHLISKFFDRVRPR
jgi:hypothetical protein